LADALEAAIEIAARARKVPRLLEAIPVGDTAAANLRCAHELAGWPQSARDVLVAPMPGSDARIRRAGAFWWRLQRRGDRERTKIGAPSMNEVVRDGVRPRRTRGAR
jgi:hypothetical protein